MAFVYPEPSRTFSEYLLVPNLTRKDCVPNNVSLNSPLVKHRVGEEPALHLHIPLVSAIMQSVSNHTMAIALAREGGLSFIFGSQPVADQAEMVRKVKKFKAGYVVSDSNLKPSATVADVLRLKKSSGHSTIAITSDGTATGRLEGILTSRDFRLSKTPLDTPVSAVMTPFEKLVYAREGATLSECNEIIWEHKLNQLPIIDENRHLVHLVFRKDYDSHKEHPLEMVDKEKRLMTGAGINSRDFKERVPALLEAGADVLCIDSSDGFNEWQADTLRWIRREYGESVYIGAGNVVEEEGFRYLVEAGADFIKVGIGPASICITREQKGIGRGQATSVMDVARARDEYARETGVYIPLCSDGGLVYDYHIALALAMGADFVMMGRYFARFDESPTKMLRVRGQLVKEYWGEGSLRARNWQRYDMGGSESLSFEEGVDAYVPYEGRLRDSLQLTLVKLKSTMCNCGSLTIPELQKKARLALVSSTSIREGGVHDVTIKDKDAGAETP